MIPDERSLARKSAARGDVVLGRHPAERRPGRCVGERLVDREPPVGRPPLEPLAQAPVRTGPGPSPLTRIP